MSLAQWTEPKACFLSRPRFIKIQPRDAQGRPVGDPYTKRIGRATCASGDPAVSSWSINGVTYHLCSSCSKADLVATLPPAPEIATRPAVATIARDGDLILLRPSHETKAHATVLAREGWTMRPRLRTVKREGFIDSRVQVWERGA